MRHRHRRRHLGPYASSPRSPFIWRAVAIVVILFFVYILGAKILDFFGVGNNVQRSSVSLAIERGNVTVSIEGDEFKRAEDQLKIYPGDTIQTNSNANARLSFFDGTTIRLDQQTEVHMTESAKGLEESALAITLSRGTVWISTPAVTAFSGSIVRTVHTDTLHLVLPSATEMVLTPSSMTVFAADGLGARVLVEGRDEAIIIGEGQKYTIPDTGIGAEDPYTHRTALDPLVLLSPFVEESRAVLQTAHQKSLTTIEATTTTEPMSGYLTITSPENNKIITASTALVTGRITEDVDRVRINGYSVELQEGALTFSQELALPDEDDVTIRVEALAEDGTVLDEVSRTVVRDRKPPAKPTITTPAGNDSVYQTPHESIEIIGTASPDTIGIIVNDYRLQLYTPGDETWTYLASTKLDNFRSGKNVFTITALNKGGYVSEPATITIWLKEGAEGVIQEAPTEESESTDTQPVDEFDGQQDMSALPSNPPLIPGSLVITGPTAGTHHSATGSELLIEGTTHENTASLWVNDYQLRLYTPGRTYWNYIADTKLGTMSRGRNTYSIVARDHDGSILDRAEYTIDFNP